MNNPIPPPNRVIDNDPVAAPLVTRGPQTVASKTENVSLMLPTKVPAVMEYLDEERNMDEADDTTLVSEIQSVTSASVKIRNFTLCSVCPKSEPTNVAETDPVEHRFIFWTMLSSAMSKETKLEFVDTF